jgi:hypothetical protein
MPAFDNYSEQPPAVNYTAGTSTVTTTASLLVTVANSDGGLLVNNTSSVIVYLGGSGVTAAAGFPVAANSTVVVPTIAGVSLQLYAVAASTTAAVSYLYATA